MSDTPAQAALRAAFNSRLPTSGGTMTGELILNGDPSTNLAAATKQYVDNGLSDISWDSLVGKPDLATVATTGNYNDLIDRPSIPSSPYSYVTASWHSGENFYRVWSDGFIEQGGLFSKKRDTALTVYLHRKFTTTTYKITSGLTAASDSGRMIVSSRSTNSFKLQTESWDYSSMWYACGW